jgi:hypothetical protein
LYADCDVAVQVNGKMGEGLPSTIGVKQGCPLISRTLFGLFADGINRYLLTRGPHAGAKIGDVALTAVTDLGYADDFVLLSSSPEGLQQLVTAAADFFRYVGMQISAVENKVMVFGTSFPGPSHWHVHGAVMECVQQYKYVGIIFSSGTGLCDTFGHLKRIIWAAWAAIQKQYGSRLRFLFMAPLAYRHCLCSTLWIL